MTSPPRLGRRTLAWIAAVSAALTGLCLLGPDDWIARGVIPHLAPLDALFGHVVTAAEFLVGYPIHKLFAVAALGAAAAVAWAHAPWRAHARPLAFIAVTHLVARTTTGHLKGLFARVRPFQAGDADALHTFYAGGHGFPSGHTTHFLSLALAVMLVVAAAPGRRALLLVVPVLVALSRLGTNDHYLSDVLGAVTVTAVVALAVSVPFGVGRAGATDPG